jgi:hypothetical protein
VVKVVEGEVENAIALALKIVYRNNIIKRGKG